MQFMSRILEPWKLEIPSRPMGLRVRRYEEQQAARVINV